MIIYVQIFDVTIKPLLKFIHSVSVPTIFSRNMKNRYNMNLKKYVIRNGDFVDFKRKALARKVVTRAVRSGELKKPSCCELCKEAVRVSAHHIDYGRPLSVLWLCDSCHGNVHTKKHPLNPNNNKQTPNSVMWDEQDSIQIAFHIPVKNFIALKKLSEEEGVPLSKLIRQNVLKEFIIDDGQLEFNFGETYENTRQNKHESLPSMVEDETSLLRREIRRFQESWGFGNKGMSRMDNFSRFLSVHGGHSSGLQRPTPAQR